MALRPHGTGVQTYIRELLSALRTVVDARLVAAVQADAVRALPRGVVPVVRPVSDGVARAFHGLRAPDPAPTIVHGLDIDLPARPRAPTVTTVHDLSVFDVPGDQPRVRVLGERLLIRRAVAAADEVVAVSSFTAERVQARFGRTATVTALAPPTDLEPASPEEAAEVRKRWDLPERFVLAVGTADRRKGFGVLADAARRAGVPAVLAGRTGPTPPPGLHSIGYVPRRTLPGLYAAATIVAYPSVYEGFGLPPLEAMRCGAAVVASRVGAMPDVAGDGARLVPPGDTDALATALSDLLADDEQRFDLAARGRRAAAALSWDDTAEATAAVYRRLGLP